MPNPNNPKNNIHGYADPTAYAAIREPDKYYNHINKKARRILGVVRYMLKVAGFDLVERLEIKHIKSGRLFK